MAEQDFTQAMRDIDSLQQRIDDTFKRVNADPVYHSIKAIEDAISDNPRYFNEDRKAELGEIFFAILEQICERIVKQNVSDPACNPQIEPAPGAQRLPQTEMLMRDMMPLAWSLSAAWNPPDLKGTYCTFFQSFTEAESQLFFDLIEFLAGLFPEFRKAPGYADFHEFWDNLAHHRENLKEEDDAARSRLLTVLVEKKLAFDKKNGAPERRYIIPNSRK